ncbi:MAG: LCP family protein [Ilumatobacteraceae bacterium]
MGTVRELALALVVPGWAQRRSRLPVALALGVVGVALPLAVALWVVVSGRSWVALSLDSTFLAWVLVAFVAALVARLIAVGLWFADGERSRDRVTAGAVAGLVAFVPLSIGIVDVAQARSDIAPVFTPTADGGAVFDPDVPTTPTDTTLPTIEVDPMPTSQVVESPWDRGPLPTIEMATTTTTTVPCVKPSKPDSGVDPAAVADVRNILLLGGDAGPGRGGLRTDTMMLLSVHLPSGRASLVSIPRDMTGLLFPPGSALEQRYPYGFTELANAVYPIVSSSSSLRSAYDGATSTRDRGDRASDRLHARRRDPRLRAGRHAGLPRPDRRLGGVTVQVTKQIPMPGNVPGAKHEYPPTIGPGTVEMDGTVALGYVRSRYADSDYQRTRRQRDLLAALAQQVSPLEVLSRYDQVLGAVGGTLRTSLTPDELADILALIGGETAIVESVGLVPPLVRVKNADAQAMAEIVGKVRLAIAQGTASGY